MHVSLAEALEVRGGPLQEEEIWAVLNQSAESLQELFRKVSIADPAALGFIISPWSLLLLPSGSVSFTDENISNQDLRAFTAPEVLQNQSLTSLSDVEKIHIYSLGMTLYWGLIMKYLRANLSGSEIISTVSCLECARTSFTLGFLCGLSWTLAVPTLGTATVHLRFPT